MAKVCVECGKKMAYFDKWRWISSNEVVCDLCYEKCSKYQKIVDSMMTDNNKTSKIVKSDVELLYEILTVNKKQLEKLDTIQIILIFFAILVILGLVASFIFR
jgi:hypothetical protein